MDDVDYLVEDNTMDDFCLSSRKDRAQVSPLLKMILDDKYREGRP